MNKILKNLLALIIIVSCISNYSTAQEDTTLNYIKEYIRRIVDNGKSTSIIIGIINKNGRQIFSYGELEKGSGEKPNENTLYGIGSITKLLTCTLLADMVKNGELSLNDPISKFLPKSVGTPVFNRKEITLYDLATHTSGLPQRPNNLSPTNPDNPYADYTIEQAYDFLNSLMSKILRIIFLLVGIFGMNLEQQIMDIAVVPLVINHSLDSIKKLKLE